MDTNIYIKNEVILKRSGGIHFYFNCPLTHFYLYSRKRFYFSLKIIYFRNFVILFLTIGLYITTIFFCDSHCDKSTFLQKRVNMLILTVTHGKLFFMGNLHDQGSLEQKVIFHPTLT